MTENAIENFTEHYCEPRTPLVDATTWVLTTKRVGDKVAGWVIDSLDEESVRCLETSERCQVTSFCYPTGARVVRARLMRELDEAVEK